MSVFRRSVVIAVALIALGAALVVLIPRVRTPLNRASDTSATDTNATDTSATNATAGAAADGAPAFSSTPTSEDLIAAALKAGEITYEESLLARAYAIYDDPRLQKDFRSPIVDWEAGSALFIEVAAKEPTLSKDLLAALAPFRVRPNDPSSIHNRPRAEVVKAQLSLHGDWEGRLVTGTSVRLWNKGALARRADYDGMIRRVWRVFDQFFSYPLADDGTFASTINPDGAIDIYLVDGQAIDPRTAVCQPPIAPENVGDCTLMGDRGAAHLAASATGAGASGYVIINRGLSDDDTIDTIAHELAHVTQVKYDRDESLWLRESTATWVGYKVSKSLSITPAWEYDWLKYTKRAADAGEFLSQLHMSLDRLPLKYGSWLFFYYASMELGDGVVTAVWKRAATPGPDSIVAVNDVIPLQRHFQRFTVRNWNRDPVPTQYKTKDDTFRQSLKPVPVKEIKLETSSITEIPGGLLHLSAEYYRFTFADTIRTVTFQNLPPLVPHSHVWAITKIGEKWNEPEEWTNATQKIYCRDSAKEALTELVLIVSNSHTTLRMSEQTKQRVLAEDVGCSYVEGWARATLHVKQGEEDLTYVARETLRFRPRTIQETVGVVQYDLMPTTVTWTVSGKSGDCTVAGQARVIIPDLHDQPIDVSRTVQGYLRAIGVDGGDWHAIEVMAFDPKAMKKTTCPGDPPSVSENPFDSAHLLHILTHPNTHDGNTVVFKGKKTFDPENILDSMPTASKSLVESLMKSKGLGKLQVGRRKYEFEWELRPAVGPPPAGGPRPVK